MTATSSYISVSKLLAGDLPELPAYLDSLDFDYEGIRVHAYGVLHGLTGGTNRRYVALVNDTIKQAPGFKLGEKGMSVMYEGLDGELDDWLQVPLKDAFCFPISLLLTPARIALLASSVVKEYLTTQARFGAQGIHQLQDIGGTAAFHLLPPMERRQLAGFLAPRDYLLENLLRRKGKGRAAPPQFPDPDWRWLPLIEPYVNIPCRSVHMLEFAVALARLKGEREVSLFVGEIHNSDMAWYQEYRQSGVGLPDWAEKEVCAIREMAQEHAKLVFCGGFSMRKCAYGSAMLAGMAIPVVGYTALIRWLAAAF